MNDPVNHPSHYTSHPSGVEAIQITRHMDFDTGNAMKYLWRAGLKGISGESDADKRRTIEDLEKAVWYVQDRIQTIRATLDQPQLVRELDDQTQPDFYQPERTTFGEQPVGVTEAGDLVFESDIDDWESNGRVVQLVERDGELPLVRHYADLGRDEAATRRNWDAEVADAATTTEFSGAEAVQAFIRERFGDSLDEGLKAGIFGPVLGG